MSLVSVFFSLFGQGKDWFDSRKDTEKFFKKNYQLLQTISFGASFSSEYIEELYAAERKSTSQKEILELLKIVVEEFYITDIRLGLRWSTVAQKNGDIDLSYYKDVLSYCMNKKCVITLNIGPIKTFRWPEQYVPNYILKNLKHFPQKGAIIRLEHELAQEGIEYTKKLLKALKQEFKASQLQAIKTIQPKNESFHCFGVYEWRLSEDYLSQIIEILHKEFPDVGLHLNSSENRNIKQIQQFFGKILKHSPELKGKLILGYNYYYLVPGRFQVPFIKNIDSITMHKKCCVDNISCSRKLGFGIEISEAQIEPWVPITSPGNSVREFRFLILRSAKNILDQEQKSIIRLWGVEQLAKRAYESKLDSEHREIIEIIKRINTGKIS